MKLTLLLAQDNVIIGSTTNYTYVKVSDGQYVECLKPESMGILDIVHNTVYPNEHNLVLADITQVIPEGVELNSKYCYTEEQGFYKNPNWVEPPRTLEQLDNHVKENDLQRTETELEIDFRLSLIELGLI